jgi:hypothetical protein
MELKQTLTGNNDFIVEVLASTLLKCRDLISEIKKSHNNISEFFLAFSTLCLGSILGAWQGGINSYNNYWWVFYIILPIIASTCLVSYGFLSHYYIAQPSQIAQIILNDLPDPNDTVSILDEATKLIGKWSLESTTHISNKTSSGELNLQVNHGKISLSGIMFGQNANRIGEVTSLYCNYDSAQRQLLVIYRLFVSNDNNILVVNECILSGIVFFQNDKPVELKGNWNHLYQLPVSGTVTLKKIL